MSGGFTSDWLLRHQLRHQLNPEAGRRGVGRPTYPDQREVELQEQIEAECQRRGWLTVRSRMDQATTTRKGVCDFIIYAEGGRMFHVECKRSTGKMSLEQRAFAVWAEKLGHRVHVVRSFTEFLEITNNEQA